MRILCYLLVLAAILVVLVVHYELSVGPESSTLARGMAAWNYVSGLGR